MIHGIDLRSLRNAEFIQFSKSVLNIVAVNDAANMQVYPQYQAFAECLAGGAQNGQYGV